MKATQEQIDSAIKGCKFQLVTDFDSRSAAVIEHWAVQVGMTFEQFQKILLKAGN